jgi:hypothetical protein
MVYSCIIVKFNLLNNWDLFKKLTSLSIFFYNYQLLDIQIKYMHVTSYFLGRNVTSFLTVTSFIITVNDFVQMIHLLEWNEVVPLVILYNIWIKFIAYKWDKIFMIWYTNLLLLLNSRAA